MPQVQFSTQDNLVKFNRKKTPAISQAERQKRLIAWEKALANFALEDIHPTDEMIRIGFMYISGEISFEQRSEMMRASILAGK